MSNSRRDHASTKKKTDRSLKHTFSPRVTWISLWTASNGRTEPERRFPVAFDAWESCYSRLSPSENKLITTITIKNQLPTFIFNSSGVIASYGIGSPIMVRSLTGNSPMTGVRGSLVHEYNFSQNGLHTGNEIKASLIFCVNTGIIGCNKKTQ